MIKNLVFKGGGVLGIAYAGALHELEANGTMASVERVAGTSAGAIAACLIALRYNAADVADIVGKTDFKAFEDGENPFRLLTKYGLYDGQVFLDWIREKITAKVSKQDATFSDLNRAGCLDLHVFATDLNTQSLKRFSFAETPDTIVAEAIRASMSIPLFFHAWQFSNSIPDNHIYIDGGAVYNYPLTAFDEDGDNLETIGFFLNSKPSFCDFGFDSPVKYIVQLAETALNSQNINLETDKEEQSRTIMIDSMGISSTDFGLDVLQKAALFEAGREAIVNHFKNVSEPPPQ